VSLDRLVCADRGDVGGVVGCSLVESSVRATVVVVLDVFLEELSMLVFVPDDGAVEEFVTECPDPSFGVCVGLGRPRRCSGRGDCGSGEDSVEGSGELSGAGSVACRVDPGCAEDLSDGRRGEFVTEPCELVSR
jgi:hypothetical protein